MLLDFTEGSVTALPHERPHALVIRVANNLEAEGYIEVGSDFESPPLTFIKEDSFAGFTVHELTVRSQHLIEPATVFWVHSAYTDGTFVDRCSFFLVVIDEGANGWWVEIRRNPLGTGYLPTGEMAFRLPLVGFDPNFDPDALLVERPPDWARLTSDEEESS